MLSDPIGHSWYCFTALASYITDTPEAMMLAMVGRKTSPVTMAMYKQFRDAFHHEPWMKSMTLAQLAVVRLRTDPNDIEPFWWDYILADPSRFLTPESLHHLHKVFFDHNTQWLINTVGDSKIDFQFSVLQPITGHWHFHGGISKLKQVTSCCQRDIQHYIIAVSADAAPAGVIAESLLPGFIGGRDSGLPTSLNTPTLQRSKTLARSSNNNNYDTQICRHLDRAEKCHRFELATGLMDHEQRVEEEGLDLDAEETDVDVNTQDIPIDPTRHPRQITSYFAIAKALQHREVGCVPVPLRSFVNKSTAFHLSYDPSIRSITVDEVAIKFGLPDLRQAIADFLQCEATYGQWHVHAIGGPRRAGPAAVLPFNKVQVWFKIRLQEMDLHNAHAIKPAQTLNCAPPNDLWILGHYDTVIAKTSAGFSWPSSRLSGHTIVQIGLIMRPIGKSGSLWSWKDWFLTYVQHFDLSNDRDPMTHLHILKQAKRSNGNRMGNIIPVSQLRAPVQLIPHFGATADKCLTVYNSLEHAMEFWLNEFLDKSTFFALSFDAI
ncbi:hypothetical protein DFH29DRAFT_1008203 [Suillus ampliporus]|nr:hypothetical protein DFH29DRAFT_1008203 [Suillus ampliporus]